MHNGWPNYETWLVYTWLTNDPTTDRDVCTLVCAADSMGEAADAVKAYVDAENPLAEQASLYTDLIGAALSHVCWLALAEHFWTEEHAGGGGHEGRPPR
jgi:hypothetical protein